MVIKIWWIWMIIAAIFVVGEIFTAGFFLLWFGVGAVVAGVLALLGLSFGWQLASFAVVSLVLFVMSRRFAERFSKKQPPGIGADRFIGKQGIVLEDITIWRMLDVSVWIRKSGEPTLKLERSFPPGHRSKLSDWMALI